MVFEMIIILNAQDILEYYPLLFRKQPIDIFMIHF